MWFLNRTLSHFLSLLFLLLGENLFAQERGFVPNQGQWPSSVLFRTGLENHKIWLQSDAIIYQLIRSSAHPLAQEHARRHGEPVDTARFVAHVFKVHFEGAQQVSVRPEGPSSETRYNYYLGKNPSTWKTGIRPSPRVRYPELYKGTDLILHAADDYLKYDFELAPGNNGAAISLRFEGADKLWLDKGTLKIKTRVGILEEHIPKAYQLVAGSSVPVVCEYVLNGNRIGFRFPKGIDPRYRTVIDPQLVFFTYSGSLSDNWANTAVSDDLGNSYTAGTVFSASFPTTTGAFDRTYNGNSASLREDYAGYDIGILKFDPSGSNLLTCTFLGGRYAETPHSLAIDKDQNLLILGTTSSNNFPITTGAYQSNFQGGPIEFPFGYLETFPDEFPTYALGSDLFIARLKADGTSLLNSTYFGGAGTDGLMSVVENLVTNYGDQFRGDLLVDSSNHVYVASHTHSAGLTLPGAFQSSLSGIMDGLVLKFTPDLTELVWGTLVGGSGEDAFFGMRLLGNDRLVLCGGTTSKNFPTTSGAFQAQSLGGLIDGTLVVLNRNSGALIASTLLSTNQYDQAYLVDVDPDQQIYVFGQTTGSMPRSENTFGTNRGGQFIHKYNPQLNTQVWATTFGSTPNQPNIVPVGFMVDSCFRIFLSGWGGNVNYSGPGFAGGKCYGMPVTPDAVQPLTGDSSDFYFLVLDRNARSMIYGTYLGANSRRGEHVDGGTSRFDKHGVITQAVCGCRDFTNSNNFFKGTAGAYQPNVRSSNCNNGVLKFNLLDLKVKFELDGELKCPRTLSLTNRSENGSSYTWYFGNGDSLITNSRIINYIYPNPGTYIITLKAENPLTCRAVALAFDTVTVPDPLVLPPRFESDSFCVGDSLFPAFPEIASYQIAWSPSRYLSNPGIFNPIITPLGSQDYVISVRNSEGCIAKVNYRVQNKKLNLGLKVTKNFEPCTGIYKVRFESDKDSSDRYVWYIGNADTAYGRVVDRIYQQNGIYPVRLNGSKESCEENAFDTLFLLNQKVVVLPDFETAPLFEDCSDPEYQFINKTLNGEFYTWDFGDGFKSTEVNPRHQYAAPGTYQVTLEGVKSDCREVKTIPFTTLDFFVPNLVTLNQDNKNENFMIRGLQPGWGLEVYNRWGKKVFESSDYKNNWVPGDLSEGTYFFNIRFPEGGSCRSWLQVLK